MSLGERPILLLQLLEQPHVLDGDDSLGSEGLEEGDLPRSRRRRRARAGRRWASSRWYEGFRSSPPAARATRGGPGRGGRLPAASPRTTQLTGYSGRGACHTPRRSSPSGSVRTGTED